jgi:hypothetical protein
MGILGLFKSLPFPDASLGELIRGRGFWRGSLLLDSVSVPLVLSGTRSAPDAEALATARSLRAHYPAWRARLEAALFEHFQPYADAKAAGECEACIPDIAAPEDIWVHVSLQFVAISPLDGAITTELGYTTAWDEEHTLGARFRGGQFLELCGSVLAP